MEGGLLKKADILWGVAWGYLRGMSLAAASDAEFSQK
jgi:hypothetical protein